MCGIAGALAREAASPADVEAVELCAAGLVHRGPDDSGLRIDGPAVLAHRRLSILDLSDAGRQPMVNESGTVMAVVNGELYNYRALRAELIARGHTFRSASDSEVLVHLYEEEGVDCLRRLEGMFAFALWDQQRQTLFCARDRFGKKPLYWRFGPRGLRFASELAPLTALPEAMGDTVDLRALDLYLALQYIPSPHTAFRGVHKLAAGHYLLARPGAEPVVRRYWQLDFGTASAARPPWSEQRLPALATAVRGALEEAVRARLCADVPLGAFLSGGLDSSAVVAILAQLTSEPPHTFSVGFEGDPSPELPHAALVARHVGARHEELLVRADPERVLPELAWRYGEPFADPSALPTYYLSQAARRFVTVALSGDGGDELFGGYRRYLYAQLGDAFASVPRPLRALFSQVGRRLPGAALTDTRRFSRVLGDDEATRYLTFVGFADAALRRALYVPEAWHGALPADGGDAAAALFTAQLAQGGAAGGLNRLLALDVSTYLADCILPKVDIASMAHALEVRAPLLDQYLAEHLAPLPARFKLHRGRGKRLLRAAVADLLPPEILARRKRGFDPPLARWLRGPLRDVVQEALGGLGRRGLLRVGAMQTLEREHYEGTADHSNVLYALLMLELWWREVVDGRAARARLLSERAAGLRRAARPMPW